ncbi:hypothetical protein CIPAW_09G082100 [Carya illinoinensis]|uniref:Secreted protein n=1 Tax=Carya illinoinensis TaxID=32201 RepID=A0A8T1PBR8_CARIL|nr:hypothetical protein CIPAW_09G082100 [Carya illinoinensis]
MPSLKYPVVFLSLLAIASLSLASEGAVPTVSGHYCSNSPSSPLRAPMNPNSTPSSPLFPRTPHGPVPGFTTPLPTRTLLTWFSGSLSVGVMSASPSVRTALPPRPKRYYGAATWTKFL